jgi:type I restriction enzyme M protein
MTAIVDRLWSFCHVLRHDGVDYADYIEQLSYLLFIKMAAEKNVTLPKKAQWNHLNNADQHRILDAYRDALSSMAENPGMLGDIFRGSESRITSQTSLRKLVDLINDTEWTNLDIDVQAATFEGLLERAAAEGKKGAGQYFTPRPLIQSIVSCVMPTLSDTSGPSIVDPACGTGGFLVAARDWISAHSYMSRRNMGLSLIRQSEVTYCGTDLVARPRRLALMNMYLHGANARIDIGDSIYEPVRTQKFDLVLTNPPFGSQGALGTPYRGDFAVHTANKQLNFVQHAVTLLKPGGSAAIVVPDNVLFSNQAISVLRHLTLICDLHTILRCPNGTFSPYTQGTKTNVLFFSKGVPTSNVWIYDGRTSVPAINRKNVLTRAHFSEFEECYRASDHSRKTRTESDSQDGRWRRFPIRTIESAAYRIDSLRWLSDATAPVSREPLALVTDAMTRLQGAAEQLSILHSILQERL